MDLTKKNAFSDENLNDLFDLIHVAVERQSEEGKALSLTFCTLKVKNMSKCLKFCKTHIGTQPKALNETN